MLELNCAACGEPLEVDPRLRGQAVRCPACGAAVQVPQSPASGAVIDVKAEVIGTGEQIPPQGADPGGYRPGGPQQELPRGFTWIFERRAQGGPGCCTFGCLLMLVILGLAIQGLFSLF